MTGVAGLKAMVGAWFAVEMHGPEATPAHAENLVYEHNGREYGLDDFIRAAISTARTKAPDGEGLTDDEVADRLIAKFDTGPEAEG